MISTQAICAELARHGGFISTVELAMILESSAQEVRDSLVKLGDRVTHNEHDEWRITGSLVHKLELPSLSEAEIKEKEELEQIVQQSFYNAAMALKILRDKKLYRETHKQFESYVEDEFGFSRRKAYYLIDAYDVVENLKCEPMVHILPTSERQCREVAKLPPEQQLQGWLASVERASGKVPSARIIKQVVQEIRGEEAKVINPKNRKDGPVIVPGIGVEYIAVLDEQTHALLEQYQHRVGKATFNGAIRQLLDEENQRTS